MKSKVVEYVIKFLKINVEVASWPVKLLSLSILLIVSYKLGSGASSTRRERMSKGLPLATEGNPLVSLAVAVIKAVLYVLDQVKNLVTWCTITFPGYIMLFLIVRSTVLIV